MKHSCYMPAPIMGPSTSTSLSMGQEYIYSACKSIKWKDRWGRTARTYTPHTDCSGDSRLADVPQLECVVKAGRQQDCHEIFGPGQNLVQLDKICQLVYLVHPATNGPMQSACVYKCENM